MLSEINKLKEVLLIFIVIIFIFSPNIVHAQRSIGEVKIGAEKANENILDIPVKQWLGKRFIFLEQPKRLQKFGYELYLHKELHFYRGFRNHELESETTYWLRYDKFAGKVIKVVNIGGNHIVTFVEEKTNLKIYAAPHKGHIDGIALFDDLAKAKERWLGKTIYARKRTISTYNAELDKHGEIDVKIGDPLKVLDVWWGFYSSWPIWVIVETTKGEKGYIATKFSWTNIYIDWWTENRPWEDDLFEFNPRESYKWSDEIWALIDKGKVRIGMNKEQVKLSWRKPKKINKDIYSGSIHEQWIYGNQYLYFENDKLTAIQSH